MTEQLAKPTSSTPRALPASAPHRGGVLGETWTERASSLRREALSPEKARPPPPSPRPPPRPQGSAGPGSIPGTPSPPPESGSSSLQTRSTPLAAAAAPPKVEAQPPWSLLASRRKLSNCWPRARASGSCGRSRRMTPAYRKEPREP